MTINDARALECEEVADCRRIIAEGTSADAELAVYRAPSFSSDEEALDAVVSWIVDNTLGDDAFKWRRGHKT